jgi:hypothetical protein
MYYSTKKNKFNYAAACFYTTTASFSIRWACIERKRLHNMLLMLIMMQVGFGPLQSDRISLNGNWCFICCSMRRINGGGALTQGLVYFTKS